MAKALQTPVSASVNGSAAVVLAAPNGTGSTNGDTVPANSIVYVENGSGGVLTVTVKMPNPLDGQTVTDKPVAIANGAKVIFGPFTSNMKQLAGAADAGLVYLEYSTITTVTRTVIVTPW